MENVREMNWKDKIKEKECTHGTHGALFETTRGSLINGLAKGM